MGGQNWKKWQEEQDAKGGPNAKNPSAAVPPPPKPKKKKVLTAQELGPGAKSPLLYDNPDIRD